MKTNNKTDDKERIFSSLKLFSTDYTADIIVHVCIKESKRVE